MQRRTVLRRGTGALALAVPLAGCSDGGNGTDTNDGTEGTPTPSGPTGEVTDNAVDELEVVDMQVEESEEEQFRVVITVRNGGNQETDAFNYEYGLTVFDGDGNDVTAGVSGTTARGATIAPGEETELTLTTGYEESVDEIASYEITVGCDSFGDSGVYCES